MDSTSFRSRKPPRAEMATLIRKQAGDPFVAPSMREMPIESNSRHSSSPNVCSPASSR